MRTSLEAAMVVEAARTALRRLGATNAVALVIDEQVLFQDREGREDDLGDLYLAFHSHAPVFGKDFSVLRLTVEHEEPGLHIVMEIQARSTHPEGEPAARVVVSGRVKAFEARPGEDAEEYRARVEPLTRDSATWEMHRHQFETFVTRVADALRGALPESRVAVRSADALVQKPSRVPVARESPPPLSPQYDPHDRYYPSPYAGMLTAMTWGSLFMMAMPPHVTIINDRGEALGTADQAGPDADGDGYADDGMDGDGDGGDSFDAGFDGGGSFDGGGGFD